MKTPFVYKLIRKKATDATGARLCIVGVGKTGCMVVDRCAADSVGLKDTVAVIGMDGRHLESLGVATRIKIGDAKGAGGQVRVGREAAERDIEMLRGVVEGCDILIAVAGLGGGTGTGALPVLLKVARESGVFAVALVAMPFGFEGNLRRGVAEEGLKRIQDRADVVMLADAGDLALTGAKTDDPAEAAFARSLSALSAGVGSLWQVLATPTLMSLDQSDFKFLATKGSGTCVFVYGTASGVDRVAKATEMLKTSPGLSHLGGLKGTGGALLCVCGSHNLTMQEVADGIDPLNQELPEDSDVRTGVAIHEGWQNRYFVAAFVADRKRTVKAAPRTTKRTRTVKRGDSHSQVEQPEFNLDVPASPKSGAGRFNRMAATILDGENLDIPTYKRRGIELP